MDRSSKRRFLIGAILAALLIVSAVSIYELFLRDATGLTELGREDLSIGERFQRETSMTWLGVAGDLFAPRPKEPPKFKTYPEKEVIALPEPNYQGIPLEEAIEKRRSVRNYSPEPLTLDQLSQLLFAAQGVTGEAFGLYLRSVPSAGALYPFEIYLVVNDVAGLARGIYHYSVLDHGVVLLRTGDYSSEITSAGLDQEMLGKADVIFILAAIFDRTRHTYGERGFRYVYIEAGHISQNIYLQAVSLGLGSVSVGAFLDEKANQLIEVDGETEAVIYLHPVGTL